MSTFYYNRSSGEDMNSQWVRHLQTQSYIADVSGIVSQNKKDLQTSMQNASTEQRQALQQVCGTLDAGFQEVNKHLQEINCNISELRGEINAMAAMLDWRLSQMIEEQRLTNNLLGQIAHLLRIPDSQKQRVYHIEQGLKYLKNAILEGIDSAFYSDSLESFKDAENIERKDFITLNRIGQIYLYSRKHMNIPLAEEYFSRSAREALAEANAGGTPTARNLGPRGRESLIYSDSPFKAATAEAHLYAARACYLQQKLPEAISHASSAYRLIPEFTEAGFEHAKYLAASNNESESASVLESVIAKDRYFAIKTLADADLSNKRPILELLARLQAQAISRAKQECTRLRNVIRSDSEARKIVEEAERHVSDNNFIAGMKAIDLLSADYQLPYKAYRVDSETIRRQTVTTAHPLFEFVSKENGSAKELIRLTETLKREVLQSRIAGLAFGGGAVGVVVGFFRGCTVSTFSMDAGTWFGTTLICAVVGALIGFAVGSMYEPSISDS